MVTCDCTVNEAAGVALVEAVLSSSAANARRVTLAARVDGPIWPPRTNGVPERPWSAGELTVVVPGGERLAVGFATPADPASRPVEVVDEERADGDGESLVAEDGPGSVVRALGDGRPPRDAVPEPDEVTGPDADEGDHAADPVESRRESPAPVAAWLDAVERRLEAVEAPAPNRSVSSVTDTAKASLAAEVPELRAVAERANALAARCEQAGAPDQP